VYENIHVFYLSVLDNEIDMSSDSTHKLRHFLEILPLSRISQLSIEIGDNSRSIRYLELEYRSTEDKKQRLHLIEDIQKIFFASGDIENGNGLADFFDPRDNRQLSFIMDGEKNVSSAIELRLKAINQGASTSFDVQQLLSSASHLPNHVLDLIYDRVPKSVELIEVLRKHEEEACITLGHWQLLSDEYSHSYTQGQLASENELSALRWAVGLVDLPCVGAIRHEKFRDILLIKNLTDFGADLLIKATSSQRKPDRLAFQIRLFNQLSSEHPGVKDAMQINLVQSLRRHGMSNEAFNAFLQLKDEVRRNNIQLEAKLLHDSGLTVKAIELLEFAIEENIVTEPYKAHVKLAHYKHQSGHYADMTILKHYETAIKLTNDAQVYFRFAKYLDQDFGLLSLQEYIDCEDG